METVSKTLVEALAKVNECTERVTRCEGQVPQIERDLLLDALRRMYDAVYALGRDAAAPIPTEIHEEEHPEALPVEEAGQPLAEKAVAAEATATLAAEQAVAAVEEPVDDPKLAPLMMDDSAQPHYAEETAPAEEAAAGSQPSMEEIEGSPNNSLFEEESPLEAAAPIAEEPMAEPTVPETAAAVEETPEVPKTLWDKLQNNQASPTLGEQMQGGKTIFDQLSATRATVASAAAMASATLAKAVDGAAEKTMSQPAPLPEPEPLAEPMKSAETAPAEQSAAPVQPAIEKEPIHQSSLFDYIGSKNTATQPATRTLADSLGTSMADNSVEEKINTHKVSDLRTIININDKFSFMNELFHNNMKGYNDFILRLNSLQDRQQALNYVGEIASQYQWDNESLAVKTFYHIFDRKF